MKSNLSQFNLVTRLWEHNAETLAENDAVIHWTAGEEPFRWTFSSLYKKAMAYALYVRNAGVKNGEVCALIIRHHKEFYPLYMGISLAGAIPAVLAYPNPRLHPDKFKEGLTGMSQRSGLDYIFSERSLSSTLENFTGHGKSTIKNVFYPFDHELITYNSESFSSTEVLSGSSPFLLQHSSGTTGLQKPVLLSHNAVIRHLINYSEAISLNKNDKIVSWLPLYHDMGLIAAFHIPLAFGIPIVQIDPFEWITIPSLLPEAVSKERGTISWLPNFAFNILSDKVHEDDLESISLKSWRLIINCSEPVRSESHRKFLMKYSPYGVKDSSLSTSYAMAETTFAVTQTPPGEKVKETAVDIKSFTKGIIAADPEGKKFLSSGIPVKGCKIKIVDNNRHTVEHDIIGEIAVSSDSLFDGYRNYPEKTAEVLSDGWYYTGDLGFEIDGYFFITGRKKDVIIVAGNNIYPEDIEYALSGVSGITPGRIIAAGEFDEALGSEKVCVIAETDTEDEAEKRKIKTDIIKAGMGIDVTINNVYLVPPRWLIKSSAGKPGRKINMDRIKKEIEV